MINKTVEIFVKKQLPGVALYQMGTGFTWDTQDREADIAAAIRTWEHATTMLSDPNYDLVVLDELTYMLAFDYLPEADVITALTQRPENQSVVVTGRGGGQALREAMEEKGTDARAVDGLAAAGKLDEGQTGGAFHKEETSAFALPLLLRAQRERRRRARQGAPRHDARRDVRRRRAAHEGQLRDRGDGRRGGRARARRRGGALEAALRPRHHLSHL